MESAARDGVRMHSRNHLLHPSPPVRALSRASRSNPPLFGRTWRWPPRGALWHFQFVLFCPCGEEGWGGSAPVDHLSRDRVQERWRSGGCQRPEMEVNTLKRLQNKRTAGTWGRILSFDPLDRQPAGYRSRLLLQRSSDQTALQFEVHFSPHI